MHDAILLWFALTGLSVAFVGVDIRHTPAHPVLRWAFVILTAFTGPLGAFFYVLGCREPIKGTHEAYVAVRWRQVLGSTMHCAAGDGVGIIAGAVIAARWSLTARGGLALEYALGFGFGWTIFQALAMRDMAGGSYSRSLRRTFLPELLSMNMLMAGMDLAMHVLMPRIDGGGDPRAVGFWFVMSMSLIAGFAFAYPMNWWLVANGLKHGMITVRASRSASTVGSNAGTPAAAPGRHNEHSSAPVVSTSRKAGMTILTLAALALAIVLADRLPI